MRGLGEAGWSGGTKKQIVMSASRDTEAMMEVQDAENAVALYEHFSQSGVSMFSHKTGWQKTRSLDDAPTSYREVSLFVTCKSSMPWHGNAAGEVQSS